MARFGAVATPERALAGEKAPPSTAAAPPPPVEGGEQFSNHSHSLSGAQGFSCFPKTKPLAYGLTGSSLPLLDKNRTAAINATTTAPGSKMP